MQTLMQNVASEGATGAAANAATHDNVLPSLPVALPSFPRDAVARIERLARSAMTSAPAEPRSWRLVFERRTPPFIEPLMGWTGDRDPLAQLELRFPTLEAAVGYAQRQGLRYTVRHDAQSRRACEQLARRRRAFSDAMLGRLGLCGLQGMYGQAMANADASSPPATEPGARSSAKDVVQNPNLSLDEKRSILMNRAFDEYEHDERASRADGTRWSRLKEIDEALLELERDPDAGS